MNKQEAIKEIKKQSTQAYDDFAIMRDTAIHIVNQIHEPEKPVVPQFVADWICVCKENLPLTLADAMNLNVLRANNQDEKTIHWIRINQETFAIAWIYGYEVEKEKMYRVILKRNSESPDYLVDTVTNGFRFYNNIYTDKREHTRKELEANGFGWVFDCDGIEVEEVKQVDRIKQLRKDKGLSQQALAEQIGLHYRTLQNWENGYGEISIGKAKKLAEYFGVSVGYLLGIDDVSAKDNITDLIAKVNEWAISNGLDKSDPKTQWKKAIDGDMLETIIEIAHQLNLLAYEEIKNRKGKMINGTFVKEEDL
ncbi:DUF1642 domain-containing protein [Streptococcus thermophilus]|nr:DUF1642 domain-containing protein [Streptococcus thermophilus]MDA3672868.1 DUF1642 domain-containing protein [Streptococcus thermophilus]